jgi:hypothetical protein
MTARIFNTLIGTWLFLSTFGWQHTPAQGLTALLGGTLTIATALLSIYYPRVRYLTALLAVLVFVASMATAGHLDGTFWHNAIVSIAIFVAALADRGVVGAGARDASDELSRPVSTR